MAPQLTPEEFAVLFQRYAEDSCSPEDTALLLQLMHHDTYQLLAGDLIEARMRASDANEKDEALRTRLHGQLGRITKEQAPVKKMWRRWVAAAAVLIIAAGGGYLLLSGPERIQNTTIAVQDIAAPARNKATITLGDGRVVVLDSVANGTLIAGVARKTGDGQLVIEGAAANIQSLTAYNPRGSRALAIELPDHSRVWLNAETELIYPSTFTGKQRLVTLRGEAYFEVVHNNMQPFLVQAGDQLIEDVGTSFNVNAYGEAKKTKTTLLEGVVLINNTATLKPGQQYESGRTSIANREEVMAWKNGSFYIDQKPLNDVLNELARWYDVEVEYMNAQLKSSMVFGGEMGRDLSLAQAIRVLEKMNVHCRLEGNRLIVE